MVLDEPARAEFAIRGPDGRPVAGAGIRIQAIIRESYGSVPEGLAERIEARTVTNADGRAVLTAFFPEEIYAVFISAPGLGRQYCGLLKFVGGAGGQDDRPVAGRPHRGRSRRGRPGGRPEPEAHRRGRGRGPLSIFRTDPQGRFAIPEVPVGELSVAGMPPAGSPWFLQSPSDLKVEAGKTTRVEVKAVKGVRLRGLVPRTGYGGTDRRGWPLPPP